ncbi:cupin domain-containing protein [Sphingomonas sp. DBB INV C78]|uniref:cupin domain-containing protein n=1 Tax=Sphingomonas sp. DBB INV C78 TaxID=3349434 RepID=UPI0036D399BD
MPKLDLEEFPLTNRTGYPEPFARAVEGRWYRRLGPDSGLEDFGVTHVTLAPGAWSSQRHWHEDEDEFVVILSGEAVLIEEGSRVLMQAGDCASFPKGAANGHCLINESDAPCVLIAIGRKSASDCHYPDVDLRVDGPSQTFTRKDRTPY